MVKILHTKEIDSSQDDQPSIDSLDLYESDTRESPPRKAVRNIDSIDTIRYTATHIGMLLSP